MTIAMIGHKGLPARSGGIERHVEELSTELVRLGAHVISYDRAWYVNDAPSQAGVERRWSYGISTKHLDAATHTFMSLILALREKPDIIHVHGVGPALFLPFARLLHPRARLVSTFHTIDRVSPKWGSFASLMLTVGEFFSCVFAHRTIVISETLAAYCLNRYQCQTAFVPNGVRISQPVSTQSLERFHVVPQRYFLMATRLVPHKNVHVAIEAHRLLAARRPDLAQQFPLMIAGGASWTGAYERALCKQATGLPFVRFVGECHGEELLALQTHAATHLSIAASEGMSIALLEAMALARPVIISDIPENAEVTGLLAPRVTAGDAHALSDAMECAALLSDAERNEAGARLQQLVRERHDWSRIAQDTMRVYEDVLEGARVTRAREATA